MPPTLADLRHLAASQSLFPPTTLPRALRRLGFVQADPIRAPARAQDLTLRHRVENYRVGDLERRYVELDLEEDYFVTYGFVTGPLRALLHPRPEIGGAVRGGPAWTAARRRQARHLLEFVRERGLVHPREADRHFSSGSVRNFWGGSSSATTQLLEAMHYHGLLRVARREGGIRLYELAGPASGPADAATRTARLDALVDVVVGLHAPLPGTSLASLVRRLRSAVPQWQGDATRALQRARRRLAQARIDGVDWYWPTGLVPQRRAAPDTVRLLTPFDPVVWDRTRFELLWGWGYRFEAYTPAAKRQLGYYAMPLLWRERVIGWGNLAVRKGKLVPEFGFVRGDAPRERVFRRELEAELDRVRTFLGLKGRA